MKINTEIQFAGKKALVTDVEKAVKESLKEQGEKMVDITELNIYYKPEENVAYYVANRKDGTVVGSGTAMSLEIK